jgi:hypothetical protein
MNVDHVIEEDIELSCHVVFCQAKPQRYLELQQLGACGRQLLPSQQPHLYQGKKICSKRLCKL